MTIPTPGELTKLRNEAANKAANEATEAIQCSLENSMINHTGPGQDGYYGLDINACDAIHHYRGVANAHNEKFNFDHSFFIGIRSILNKRGWDIEDVKQNKKLYFLKLKTGVELSKPDPVAPQPVAPLTALCGGRIYHRKWNFAGEIVEVHGKRIVIRWDRDKTLQEFDDEFLKECDVQPPASPPKSEGIEALNQEIQKKNKNIYRYLYGMRIYDKTRDLVGTIKAVLLDAVVSTNKARIAWDNEEKKSDLYTFEMLDKHCVPWSDTDYAKKLLRYIELLENRLRDYSDQKRIRHCDILSIQFEPGTHGVDLGGSEEQYQLTMKLNELRKARWDQLFEESLQEMMSLAGLDKPEQPLKQPLTESTGAT